MVGAVLRVQAALWGQQSVSQAHAQCPGWEQPAHGIAVPAQPLGHHQNLSFIQPMLPKAACLETTSQLDTGTVPSFHFDSWMSGRGNKRCK